MAYINGNEILFGSSLALAPVVQTTGDGEAVAMSQRAVTRALVALEPKRVYQAEAAGFSNTVSFLSSDGITTLVGGIGNVDGTTIGYLLFDVEADYAGEHTIDIYYATWETRAFFFEVNGRSYGVTCAGNGYSWDAPISKTSVTVFLQAGTNSVKVTNPNAPAPNLDRIEIAGNDVLAGNPFTDEDKKMLASSVQWRETTDPDLATTDGIWFITANNSTRPTLDEPIGNAATILIVKTGDVGGGYGVRQVMFCADGLVYERTQITGGTWTDWTSDRLATLLSGTQIDGFGLSHNDYTDSDKTVVKESKNHLLSIEERKVYQAEDAPAFSATSAALTPDGSTTYVGGIGTVGEVTGYISFDVEVTFDGERNVDIYYISLENRSFHIVVGDQTYVVDCPGNGTDWDTTIMKASTSILLKAGINNITITNPDSPAPNLDRIEIGGKSATNNIVMESPNGTQYVLSVSDDGTLSATPVNE